MTAINFEHADAAMEGIEDLLVRKPQDDDGDSIRAELRDRN